MVFVNCPAFAKPGSQLSNQAAGLDSRTALYFYYKSAPTKVKAIKRIGTAALCSAVVE